MMQQLTSSDIANQASAIAGRLAALERDASRHSYAALTGDERAVALLATINAEIENARHEQETLRRASATAQEREREAAEKRKLADIAMHRAKARKHRDELIATGHEVERLAADLVALRLKLGQQLNSLRDEVRRADYRPSVADSVVGRLPHHLENGVERELIGDRRFGSLSAMIERAWAVLDD